MFKSNRPRYTVGLYNKATRQWNTVPNISARDAAHAAAWAAGQVYGSVIPECEANVYPVGSPDCVVLTVGGKG